MKTPDLKELRRQHFPVTRDRIYLNHASYGPLTQDATDAHRRELETFTRGDLTDTTSRAIDACDRARAKTAQLLSCLPSDIAFFKGTTEALALVPLGLTWSEGDEVIVYARDHPNVLAPWIGLQSAGVVIRAIEGDGESFTADDVLAQMTVRTRAVALSWVHYEHGFRAPIEELGRLCRDRGAWFVLDAIQGIGVLELRVAEAHADVVAASTYKWLLGGLGLAVAYCSPRARRELRVPVAGFLGQRNFSDVPARSRFSLDLRDDARRFESSLPPLGNVEALTANVGLLLELGPAWTEERAISLCARIDAGLSERGYDVVRPPGPRSSIVSAWTGDVEPSRIKAALTAHRVTCSRVLDRGLLRVTPHYYNTNEDVDELLSALDSIPAR